MEQLNREGFIVSLNSDNNADPFTGEESLSKIRLKENGSIINFNSYTKISGCKFSQLKKGDRVLIKLIKMIQKEKSTLQFVVMFEIVDLQRKWEDILNNDNKLKNEAKVLTYGEKNQIIKPEVFDEDHTYVLHNVDTIKTFVDNHKFKNKKYEVVMKLYAQGKSLREIAEVVKYKGAWPVKYVIGLHLKLWGLK